MGNSAGKIIIETELDDTMIDKQIALLEDKLQGLVEEYEILEKAKPFEGQNEELIKLGREIDTTKNRLQKLNQEKNKVNKTDFSGLKSSLKNVGSGVENVTKKITRWALAFFGIRTMVSFIKSSISTLSEYDEQMAVNIEYIRYLLASTLKPIIETLIQLAYKLLAYINYLAQAWFHVNLFASASTKAFEKQHKALDKSSKKAKELQKTLAGFDEMNILQKNGDVTSGGGGGGITRPSLPEIKDVKIPSWLQWLKDNGNIILPIIAGITAGILAWKIGLGGIKALGIGVAIAGIVIAIQNLIKFLNDPTFKNFIGILEGIAIAVIGVAIAVGAWPVAVGGALALVVIEIVKHFNDIKKLFDNFIKWMDKDFLGTLRYLFGPLGDILYLPIKQFIEIARGAFNGFYGGIKKFVDGVVKIFRGDFKQGITGVFLGLVSIFTAPLQGFIAGIKGLWGQIKGYLDDLVKKINKKLKEINPINLFKGLTGSGGSFWQSFGFAQGGVVVPKLASGGIINNPGRGVPLVSAIGGEHGAEAVIPLTDSQQMALLGETIGRYITINASITNTMNGRVISKELQKINNESDFAFNR